MKITDIPDTGRAMVACSSCGHNVVVVDRYKTDYPPIPYVELIEFYRDYGGDPDDRLCECPDCGEWLDLDTVLMLHSYQYGQRWFGWDGKKPLFTAVLCIPLRMLEPNSYGCNVLPGWDSHFAMRSDSLAA